jgi:hypothetical protein
MERVVISIGKSLSDAFPTQNDVKQGDALSSLLLHFVLKYSARKLNRTHQLIVCANDVNFLGENKTPWNKVLLEKLIVSQLVKTFPALYLTQRIIVVFTRAHKNINIIKESTGTH